MESTVVVPNWLELPREVTAKILHKLGPFEIFTSASLVCPQWWKICMDPLMWRTIDLTNYPPHLSTIKLVSFFRNAVKRSCGRLEDITIGNFATGQVLRFIADSGSHLRKVRLLKCWEISDKQLRKFVKKLPLLEEFEISFSQPSKDTLELMGKCCSHLKVLRLNMKEEKGYMCDGGALAIAKTMPQLCHLQLLGNRLTNKGLAAILDGCPNLESLDLRVCSNVDLSGSLGDRCRKQIRDLRFPEDLSDEVSIYVEEEEQNHDYWVCDCYGCNIDWEGNDRRQNEYDEYLIADYYGLL